MVHWEDDCSPTACATNCRDRVRLSKSTGMICCRAPNARGPSTEGTVNEGPIKAARSCAASLSSPTSGRGDSRGQAVRSRSTPDGDLKVRSFGLDDSHPPGRAWTGDRDSSCTHSRLPIGICGLESDVLGGAVTLDEHRQRASRALLFPSSTAKTSLALVYHSINHAESQLVIHDLSCYNARDGFAQRPQLPTTKSSHCL